MVGEEGRSLAGNEASDVRQLGRMHRVGLAAVALAIAALIVGFGTGLAAAALLIIPGFVLFPYAADGLVILLYRAGVISAASANRLGCLHVTAIVLAVVVLVLSQITDSPGLFILLFPSVLLMGYRNEFVGSLGNALGRVSARDDGARRTTTTAKPISATPRAVTPPERLSRRLLVLTM